MRHCQLKKGTRYRSCQATYTDKQCSSRWGEGGTIFQYYQEIYVLFVFQCACKLLGFSFHWKQGKRKKRILRLALDVRQGASYLAETSRGSALLQGTSVHLKHPRYHQSRSCSFIPLFVTVMALCADTTNRKSRHSFPFHRFAFIFMFASH